MCGPGLFSKKLQTAAESEAVRRFVRRSSEGKSYKLVRYIRTWSTSIGGMVVINGEYIYIYIVKSRRYTANKRTSATPQHGKKKTLQRRNYFLGSCAIRVSILKGGSVAAMVFWAKTVWQKYCGCSEVLSTLWTSELCEGYNKFFDLDAYVHIQSDV